MRTKLEHFGQRFIYVILVIWLSTEVLFSSNIEYVFIWRKEVANQFVAVLVFVLLMIHVVVLQKYALEEMLLIATLTIPIALATNNSNHKTMMATWIFVVAAKYLDIDKAIKMAYIVQILMIAVVIYMFYTGMIKETTLYRGNMLRHSLGFVHPNQLGIRIFQLVLCHCYLRKDKENAIDYIIVMASIWFIKNVTDSKTAYYALVILLCFMVIQGVAKRIKNGTEVFSNALIIIYLVANSFSILFSIKNIKSIPVLKALDAIMSKRFSLCYRTYKFYGLTLFGQDIQLLVRRHIIGKMYRFWLDNAYMSILLRYGIIVFIIFSGLYLVTMVYLKKTGQYMLLQILALYAIYGIMENNYFSMSQNIFLVVLSYSLYKNKSLEAFNSVKRIRFSW